MTDLPLGHSSPAEVHARLEAERTGCPHLVLRDEGRAQMIVQLQAKQRHLTVGRGEAADVCLSWDHDVSRVHAELVRIGEVWTISDDGLARNGTFVNGERITSRQRLRDRDVLQLGHTTILFRDPGGAALSETGTDNPELAPPSLSPAQRRVLIALCRPYKESGPFSTPATNKQIAEELFLSVEAVKTHLRALSVKFGTQSLPQGQKRAKLVERAFRSGLVSERDL